MHVACARFQKEQVTHSNILLCFRDYDLLKYIFSNIFSFMCMKNFLMSIVY